MRIITRSNNLSARLRKELVNSERMKKQPPKGQQHSHRASEYTHYRYTHPAMSFPNEEKRQCSGERPAEKEMRIIQLTDVWERTAEHSLPGGCGLQGWRP